MNGNASFSSPLGSEEDDFSTGYLEDALVEFSERSKRRRLMLYSDEETIMRDHYSNLLSKVIFISSYNISGLGFWRFYMIM